LRRACLILLVIGLTVYGAAEAVEHDVLTTRGLNPAILLTVLLSIGVVFLLPRTRADTGAVDAIGPSTRGLRVDGRAGFVDLLENLLSLGRRRRILEATLEAAELRAGDRLVDVGCGTGELAMLAAARGAGAAVGIDATPDMIAMARRSAHACRSPARFEVAVAEALPLPDAAADVVTSSFFFHHLPSEVKGEALREMWRVLRPGGRLVITDYGRPLGLVGLLASFPMRFNFHEYVRPQLAGELERLVESEGLGPSRAVRVFLGYITVLRLVKPR
jgi:ubiquinone/menaquinone biosynthesis C-methylase UbiE